MQWAEPFLEDPIVQEMQEKLTAPGITRVAVVISQVLRR
jgi:hypothetical protein